MTLDETARAAAERLIGRFGTIATLRRATRTYDPATGKAVESTRDYRVRLSPPTRFHEARILFDRNHGGVAGGRFHSTRVLIDLTVSESEAAALSTPIPIFAILR